jgi:hypothetical protein
MMELIFGWVVTLTFLTLAYVGIHMTFEKDAGRDIPLIWEKNGLLSKLFRKDGDNK